MKEASTESSATADLHPRNLIARALAGLDAGGQNVEEGGRGSGPPLFESAEPGWTIGAESQGKPVDEQQRSCRGQRYYVDHVGPGRREALPIYLEALQAAGLKAYLGPLYEGHSKQVVWLEGRYDQLGHAIDCPPER